jgi:hypothetical protein
MWNRQATSPGLRLVLVAYRIHNSGQLLLDETAAVDTNGFQVVYVFPIRSR